MTREELERSIQEIGTLEDVVQIRDRLVTLQNNVSKDYDELATLKTSNQELIANNEALRSANMKLFLQVGANTKEEDQPDTQHEEALTYDSLFNEKGEINL